MPDPSFDDLMARLRAGDDAAAAAVFDRFARRLVGLARVRLDARLRQKVDPDDVLQSVFRSFFLRHAEGQFTLRDWDSLWSLLTVITVRKCGRWAEHFLAAGRDVGREVAASSEGDESGASWQALARDPTPDEVLALTELVERLMGGLDEREREVVSLHLQGCTVAEVCEQTGRPQRTVYRILDRVRDRLRRLRAEDETER